MKQSTVSRFLSLAPFVALAACDQGRSPSASPPTPRAVASTPAASQSPDPATAELTSEAELMEQEGRARAARAAADPVIGIIERAEMCLHFGGEEGFDAARRAQIDKALADEKCDSIVTDAEALKAARPKDAARLDEAVRDLRP